MEESWRQIRASTVQQRRKEVYAALQSKMQRTRKDIQQTVARATWIRRHNCPLLAILGGGKGGLELPHGTGHAVPGIVRC